MFFLLLTIPTLFASPHVSWFTQQQYKGGKFLSTLLEEEEQEEFLRTTQQYLKETYTKTTFRCVNGSHVTFPFKKEKNTELQKVYALETTACIPHNNIQNVFSLYMNPDFREKYMTGVKTATRKDNSICITTTSFVGLVQSAFVCMDFHRKEDDNSILLHNQLSFSKHEAGLQPVYYQHEFILFQQFDENVLIHRFILNRSRDLSSAGLYVLQQKSKGYPQKMIQAMTTETKK